MFTDQIQDKQVLVVGDVMLHHFGSGSADRVSPGRPALVLHVAEERGMLGGAGDVGTNIAALGGRAVLMGATTR